MQSPQTIKTVLLSVWLLLVVSVIIAIANQDRFFAMELHPIAALDQRTGSVMARAEGLVRWREVVDHQSFYDGDRVATGADSRSTVRFDASRKLKLGEDTQVQITSIRQADGGLAFMIKLFRGTMEAETDGACVDCPPLILRDDGGETLTVTSGKSIALSKAVGKKAKTFDAKTWPVVSKAERPKPILAANFVKIAKLDPAEQAAEEARLKKEREDREAQEKKDKDEKDKKDKESKDKELKDKKDKDAKDKEKKDKEKKDKEKKDKEKKEKDEKDKKDKENSVKGSEAVLAGTVNGMTLWTMEPLSAIGGATIDVPFGAPAKTPEGWHPVLELSGGGKSPVIVDGEPGAKSFKITVDQARRVASSSKNGGIAEYVFAVRGGGAVVKDKDKSQSFGGARAELRIKSLGELGGGPVTVALDGLKAGGGTGPWMDAKAALSTAEAPVAVSVGGGDYGKLVPFIRGAGAVGISRETVGNEGVFVVRGQAVVAQVKGSRAGDKATAGGVMRALGGEFVFKGSKASLYDMRGQTQTALVDWVGALLDKGKVLYILKKNKLYPVSRDFIKTNNEVAKFIDTQARAIFLERVEILDYR